jgi:hypothetical protein
MSRQPVSSDNVYLTGICLMSMYLIYEPSLRVGHGWRESLYRRQGCFEASDRGRFGRQAAGFTLIGKELHYPAIVPENVYNMDDPPNPWMAFRVLENWIHRCGNQLVLDPACV